MHSQHDMQSKVSQSYADIRHAQQDIDAVYFGDGAVNDLEDWSSFLEVPDFMASFSSSEVPLVSARRYN